MKYIGTLCAIIVAALIMPVITFGCGYLAGMVLKFFIGNVVVNGLNLIFDTTRFTPSLIPVTCGILATIGSFFKTSVSTKN